MATPSLDHPFPLDSFVFDIYRDGQAPLGSSNNNNNHNPGLPGGPCHFTDTTPGVNAPRCGCRRFWSRETAAATAPAPHPSHAPPAQAVWCMCNHHACYHDPFPPGQAGAAVPAQADDAPVVGQENEKPKTHRDPLSPVVDLSSFRMPAHLEGSWDINRLLDLPASPDHHHDPHQHYLHAAPQDAAAPPPALLPVSMHDHGAMHDHGTIPDTLRWGDVLQHQQQHQQHQPPQTGPVDLLRLPPADQHSLTASHPPSTASSSQARYLLPFSGKGLHTLSHVVSASRHTAASPHASAAAAAAAAPPPPIAHPPTASPRPGPHILSVPPPTRSGAATPAAASSLSAPSHPRVVDENRAAASPTATVAGVSRDEFRRLSASLRQRLERLENASFCVSCPEDCQEKHDHTDLRVTELETRVEEVERMLASDHSSVATVLGTGRDAADDATASGSVASVSASMRSMRSVRSSGSSGSSGSNNGPDHSALYSQLQILHAQVQQLQSSAGPSYGRPWPLEVVFLPFPLKGIWMQAAGPSFETPGPGQPPGAPGSSSSGGGGGGEWTQWSQRPSAFGRSRGAASRASSPQAAGPHWLLARACAPGGVVEQRLRSRGLVRTVSVTGPDARSVQLAVDHAFRDVFRVLPIGAYSQALRTLGPPRGDGGYGGYGHGDGPGDDDDGDRRLSLFLGLQHAWVPLRKIHKDSRLRFLSPAEMVTPALWDVAFLASSVVMKASGLQRLYITHPEAYLQDHAVGLRALEAGWTWKRLRQLSRVYPDAQDGGGGGGGGGEVPEADALEACWMWHDRLDDDAPLLPASVARQHPGLRRPAAQPTSGRSVLRRSGSSSSPSPQPFCTTGVQSPRLSSSPAALRAPSPLAAPPEGRGPGPRPRPLRARSIPSSAPLLVSSPSYAKRRVASYGGAVSHHTYQHARRPSPLAQRSSPRMSTAMLAAVAAAEGNNNKNNGSSSSSIARRRQNTKSPALAARATPRWSRASMSRSPSLAPMGPSLYGDDRADRRTTPFCYATPYSNGPPEPRAAHSRVPGMTATHVYYAEDDGDDDEDEDMDYGHGSGSGTNTPSDSEATNEADADGRGGWGGHLRGRDGGDGVDLDIDVYEDDPPDDDDDDDDLDDVDTDGGGGSGSSSSKASRRGLRRTLVEREHGHGQAGVLVPMLPEDEPWPGIEDHMSDGENVDPLSVDVEIDDAELTDVSSQPSEYPSTRRAWQAADGDGASQAQQQRPRGAGDEDDDDDGLGFRIHEDAEGDGWQGT